ncbi:MAG: HIT family protein [Sedimentisphaerales bacterium]|jgi:histidine triad (HIT) family protein
MGVQDCIFCKIASGQIPAAKIYEDEVVVAFLDVGPISDGHTLVMPRQHFEKVHSCPPELLGQIWTRLGKIAGAVASAVGSDGYNVLCNNGRAAGQVVDHLHFHIVPRKTGDGVFAQWPSYKYRPGQVEIIAEKIRKHL